MSQQIQHDPIEVIRRLVEWAEFMGGWDAQVWEDARAALATPSLPINLRAVVKEYEAGLIRAALREAKGSVSRAASLLGFSHHQSLASKINASRHRDLLSERKPIRKRRRSIIKKH